MVGLLGPKIAKLETLVGALGSGGGSLTSTSNGNVLSNISGAAALPSGNTLTAILDSVFGGAQGNILYRGASVWSVLAPGTSGNVLPSGGAGANPSWTAAGVGLAFIPDGNLLANTVGSSAIPVATSVTALLGRVLSATEGAIIFRGASAWLALAAGTPGQVLTTQGATAIPTWSSPPGASYLGNVVVASLPVTPAAGSIAFASNARKVAEGAGAGTGTMVYYPGQWRVFSSDAPVTV